MLITYQYFTQTGTRSNNEDFVTCMPEVGAFMVCDGVGGQNKGEVASKIVCNEVAEYCLKTDGVMDERKMKDAIRQAEKSLTAFAQDNPESKGMATTLTFLQLDDTAFAAHIGDSRVYYIRNGEVKFVTHDHSYVNELISSGFITEEAAKTHPKRNVITRAVQGVERPVEPDFAIIHGLATDDYFLLCSDGVTESIDEQFINLNFTARHSVDEIINNIQSICAAHSQDNNSAIVIKIIEM